MGKQKKLSRNITVDPYGHQELLPSTPFRRDEAIFLAEAAVSYEAISVTETYWLLCHDQSPWYSLWCKPSEIPLAEFCGVIMTEQSHEKSLAEVGEVMLRAFIFSRTQKWSEKRDHFCD